MAHASDVDPELTGGYLYHVVCHDCPTESISSGESEAEARLDEHRASTGHNVELAALPSGNDF
ncbi:hypothetical protein [Halobellus salinisoli]|uniref:hypothetical protein n=1 Tax=Halobellus salinisoli TaxID=3108500 RepID=UPI003008DFD1